MKETAKEGRLYALFGKALLLFAAAFVMLCINPRTAHAITLPVGSEADGYLLDRDGNLTIYTDEGLARWVSAIGGGPETYRALVKKLTVNEGVTMIKSFGDYNSDRPFYSCANLTTVSLPASLTEIGEKSFMNCKALTNVTIAEPSNLTTIGTQAFSECRALENINIPDGVTTIGEEAFEYCLKLELDAATLPSGLTAINDRIFNRCDAMTGNLTIPDGVTSIGNGAFAGAQLTSVTIPASVTSIGNSAFAGAQLTSVTIPASVTSIGGSAFSACEALDSVTMLGETPPTLGDGTGNDDVFSYTGINHYDKQIYVPKPSIMTYKESWTQWKDCINDAGYAGSVDPTAEDYANTDIDVLGFTRDAIVYSVDVEWGAMTFQYENSTWDATEHKTVTGAGWKVYDSENNKALDSTTDPINRIQVTNHSNASVWATLKYDGAADYKDTTGSFDTAEDDTVTDFDATGSYLFLDTANNAEEKGGEGTPTVGTVYFMPSGIKEEYKKADGITKWSQLGTITVGIVTEEP